MTAANMLDDLEAIGRQLDRGICPKVYNGGIVKPSDSAPSPSPWAKEKDHERSGQGRPETRTWPGTTGWKRSSDGSRPPRTTPQVICSELEEDYLAGLGEVQTAYPGTRIWHQGDGFWLRVESALLPGLNQKAVFLIGIPFARTLNVRAWGFRDGIPLRSPIWIGPRHTNFGDGSICAFELVDGTWRAGGSLVTLIDIYSVWALKHLHLEILGRWPGHQKAHYVFERLIEQKPGELCGCGSDKHYDECCQQEDRAKDIAAEVTRYNLLTGGGKRSPPAKITAFLLSQDVVPSISDLLPSSM
jgi:hypothetical protein